MQSFQEEILKKNIERQLSIQKSVETEFSKAYSTVEDAIERGVLPEFILQKGKELPIGTEKQWGQNRYIKTLKGWKLVSKEGKHYQEGGEKEPSKKELESFEGKFSNGEKVTYKNENYTIESPSKHFKGAYNLKRESDGKVITEIEGIDLKSQEKK